MRARTLNTRLIIRLAEADIRLALGILSESPLAAEKQTALSDAQATAHRIRKDLRGIRRLATEAPAERDAMTLVTKLEQVIGEVEKALEDRQFRKKEAEAMIDTEPSQDMIDSSVRPEEDTQAIPDSQLETDKTIIDSQDIVDTVRRTVMEGGMTLKRKASDVGESIEEVFHSFVRDDGTVDVKALRAFLADWLDNAGMTWKRLNGIVPDEQLGQSLDSSLMPPVAMLSITDEEREFQLREEIGSLEKQLFASSKERETALRREDQLGKLIRAKEIREMDDCVSALRRTLAIRVLQLEMEKIFVGVSEEIDNCEPESMNEQRMMVVEFAELDERLATLELFIDQSEPLLIEDDTLGELAADIQYLKTRLGLDEPLYSSETLSWPQVRQFFASSAKKTRAGIEFYSRGLRLFVGDLRFALRLTRRAITGYTPTPREIRTIRRTVKDLLTLIPFTIVLIAPLTPVGHVLIFSLLQRYWPEFFPSTFSERRQALMRKHEQYEQSMKLENGASGVEQTEPQPTGLVASLLRLLFFGFRSKTAEEGKSTVNNGVDGNGRSTPPSESNETIVDSEATDDSPHISLSDISKTAPDSERKAQKNRITIALDELHLAD